MARVLFADDSAAQRNFYEDLLTQEGHEVTVMPDGDKAIEAIRSGIFDMVITDLEMPGQNNGMHVAIEAHKKGIARIIINTGACTELINYMRILEAKGIEVVPKMSLKEVEERVLVPLKGPAGK